MTHTAHATVATPAAARFATLSRHETALLQTLYRQIGRFTALRIQGEYVDADAVHDLLEKANQESSTLRSLVANAFTQYNRQVDTSDDVLRAEACDHLVLRGRTQEDHRGDSWCRACADALLVVPEDDHRLYDRDDLYRHSDGCLYTYEQDDEDGGEDDNDGQDTDGEGSGIPSLRSYSTVAHTQLAVVAQLPNIAHWRMRTHGAINKANCHPYTVVPGQLEMMHNGILHTGNKADPSMSDTWHFIQDYLAPLSKHGAGLIHEPALVALIAEFIGDNRFAFMTEDGRLTVINRDDGMEHQDLWFSNTYAWSPGLLVPSYDEPFDDWFNRAFDRPARKGCTPSTSRYTSGQLIAANLHQAY